jgi:hypothetical protein
MSILVSYADILLLRFEGYPLHTAVSNFGGLLLLALFVCYWSPVLLMIEGCKEH